MPARPARRLAEACTLAALAAAGAAVPPPLPVTHGPAWLLAGGFALPFLAGLLLRWRGILVAVVGVAVGAAVGGTEWRVAAVGLTAAAAAAGLAAVWARRGLPFAPEFDHPRDVLKLAVGAAAVASGRAAAAAGVAAAVGLPDPLAGLAGGATVGLLAILLIAPAAVLWLRGTRPFRPAPLRVAEAAAAGGLAVAFTHFWFGGPVGRPLALPVPLLAVVLGLGYWVAYRFDTRGMATLLPAVAAVLLAGAAARGTAAPLVPTDRPAAVQWGWLVGLAAAVAGQLWVAAAARAYRLREQDRAEWVRAATKQTARLKEVNGRLALQSLELADQASELSRQRDEYQKLARELADERTWLTAVLAQLPVGVLLTDAGGRPVSRNARYEALLGAGPDAAASGAVERAVRDGRPTHDAEVRVPAAGGGSVEAAVSAAPIRGAGGAVLGAVLVAADVTPVRRAERAARDNEDRLRFALRSARMMAWEWDLATDRVTRSDRLEGWLGLEPDAAFDRHGGYAELVHPDDRPAVRRLIDGLRAGTLTEFVSEYRIRHADGSYVWVETRGQLRPAADGRPPTVVGVHANVTDRRQSEERLRLLESAVVHARDAVIVLEADPRPGAGRRVLYVNDAFTRITGYPADEAVDRSLHFLRGPLTDAGTLDRLRAALEAHAPFAGELLNYRKDGTEVWVDLSLVPVAGPDGRCSHFVMIQRDVTDRKRAEEAVRLSEERLRALGDNLPNGAIYQAVLSAAGVPRFTYISAGIERMAGVRAADVTADPAVLTSLVHPDDRPRLAAANAAAARDRGAFDCEFRLVTADGLRWVHARSQPTAQPDGTPVWNGVLLDVTARRRAEDALRESEQLFRGMFETTSAGVSVLGPDGTFVACNPAFADMLGRTTDEVLGRRPSDFTHPDDWAEQVPLVDAVADGRRDRYQVRKRYLRPDGRVVWSELSATAVHGPAGEFLYAVGVSVDVTARHALEDQLRQAQKMEAIGQMAGGIAHDFNNLLTAVIGNLGLVRLPDGDPNRGLLRTVEQAATRAADLTRKLLGYARRNQLLVAPVRPSEMVGEVVDILRRTLDPRIQIRVDVRADDVLSADATLVNQALFNLCLNARDAMPDGGVLTLSADAVAVPAGPDGSGPKPGAYVRLSVADTGCGMTEAVKARLFEPFFTTKGVGKGTGLGLPMVHGIMTQHQGWVAVDTAPGKGTRFDLYLPVARAAAGGVTRWPGGEPAAPADTPPPSAAPTAGATVLLVDDELMIRTLARTILEQAGHTVIEAEDGAEAVEVFAREHGRIDLVILDLTMPRLSGRDAFDRMVALDPSARVLFSSGYSGDDLSAADGAKGLLSKPYRPADLLAAVRRALETEDAPAAV